MAKREIIRRAFALLALVPGIGVFQADAANVSEPIHVRGSAEGRTWQTVFNRAAPVSWRWENADTAQLAVSNLTEGTSSKIGPIARSNGEKYGSVQIPAFVAAKDGADLLFEVKLSLYAGNALFTSAVARLVIQPGANGAIRVRVVDNKSWPNVSKPCLVPYDAAWLTNTAAAASATLASESAAGFVSTNALSGVSGYALFDPRASLNHKYGNFTLTLGFTEAPAAWVAALRYVQQGLVISLR